LAAEVKKMDQNLRTEHSVGYITVPNMEMADKVTDALLEQKLIACANIIPGITSKFVWKGPSSLYPLS